MRTETIQAAKEQVAHLSRCFPIDHEALNKALDDLRAAELMDPAYAAKMLAWHRRMLAAYDAKGNWFAAAEHRQGIDECLAALSVDQTAVAA